MARKIIQIATLTSGNGAILALCDDGTLWERAEPVEIWAQVDTSVVDTAQAMAGTVEAPPAADPQPV